VPKSSGLLGIGELIVAEFRFSEALPLGASVFGRMFATEVGPGTASQAAEKRLPAVILSPLFGRRTPEVVLLLALSDQRPVSSRAPV